MENHEKGMNTLCLHAGDIHDPQFKGAVSPIYPATSYEYMDVEVQRYPRLYNTPNQEAVGKKIAALEHAQEAIIFSSGMAAISTALLAFLSKGDHVVLQQTLYGGTYSLVTAQFERFGIEYSFTSGWEVADFEKEIKENTKVIYIETPSNPLLTITDMEAIAQLAKKKGLVTMIDNTFASPILQNPIDFGIDLVLHSATKYMGGHSDISAGAVAGSKEHISVVHRLAVNLGGNLSDYTVWLLERSMKTMGIRVERQSQNALEMAQFLTNHSAIEKVYYPGLPEHPGHALAQKQMRAFGGIVSFDLKPNIDMVKFKNNLKVVKVSQSLAGVESTLLSPPLTSHKRMDKLAREAQGITERLIRFSCGIENVADLKSDVAQALNSAQSV
jgi:cystathionine beta-lyase